MKAWWFMIIEVGVWSVWFFMILYELVWFFMILYDCMILYDFVWFYDYMPIMFCGVRLAQGPKDGFPCCALRWMILVLFLRLLKDFQGFSRIVFLLLHLLEDWDENVKGWPLSRVLKASSIRIFRYKIFIIMIQTEINITKVIKIILMSLTM